MFSGIGGFDLALNRQDYECVGYSEINEYSIQTYKKNFGKEVKNYGDATKIDTNGLPDFDLLCGGFPCQAFSIAGKRRGFEDTRGTLFFDIARIIKAKRPSYILLENVKGLLSHNKGETFSIIINTISGLGYDVQWVVLNSKFFGVPQNRERVFIIGSVRGQSRLKILPFGKVCGETKELVYAQKSDREIARVYSPEGISPTLHLKTGGWQEPKIAVMLKQIATKRTFRTPKEINEFLRDNKGELKISWIAEKLNIPKTQVEHYFRIDDSRAIPSPDIWIKLKEILNFDDRYDLQVTEVYNKEIEFEQTRRVYDTNFPSPTLNATNEPKIQVTIKAEFQKTVYDAKGINPTIRDGHGDVVRIAIPVLTPDRLKKRQNGRRFKENGEPSFTLTGQDIHGVAVLDCYNKSVHYDRTPTLTEPHHNSIRLQDNDLRIRKLTPLECERLQGFPDNWTQGVSDTRRYNQLGNAVTVSVVEAIAKKIFPLAVNKKEDDGLPPTPEGVGIRPTIL